MPIPIERKEFLSPRENPIENWKTKAVLYTAGQGSHWVGMGKKLYDEHESVRDLYDQADNILGIQIKDISFSNMGWDNNKNYHEKTPYIQIIVFLNNEALRRAYLGEEKQAEQIFAGRSVAHVNSLYSSGALDLRNALLFLQARGLGMFLAKEEKPGFQAAIILSRNKGEKRFEELREKFLENSKTELMGHGPYLEADNSSNEFVICGSFKEMIRVFASKKKLREQGISIKTLDGGAYHSPHMKPAIKPLKWLISKYGVEFQDTNNGSFVISNVTGQPLNKAEELREDSIEQIVKPVLWRKVNAYLNENDIFPRVIIGRKLMTSLNEEDLEKVKVTSPRSSYFEDDKSKATLYYIEKKAA